MKNNLERIIRERGLKKIWLAEQANLNKATIPNLIKGSDPKLSTAYKIANILGLTVYDIWPDLDKESPK